MEIDVALIDLVKSMEDVYSFVEATESFQNKIVVLGKTIVHLLKQTVECVIYVREYTGHGFGGEWPILMLGIRHYRPTRQVDSSSRHLLTADRRYQHFRKHLFRSSRLWTRTALSRSFLSLLGPSREWKNKVYKIS